jgi:hypothetical protein
MVHHSLSSTLPLVLLGLLALAQSMAAESLTARIQDGNLLVGAAKLHLLQGTILDRLRNGATVAFDFHLALWTGSRSSIQRRSFERFVVSYDLWEEKFSVTGLRKPGPSVTGLSAAAVPAWCLDHISLPGVDPSGAAPFGLRLDIQLAERGPGSREEGFWEEDGSVSLKKLIDLFSRPSRGAPNRWSLETGPLRQSDLVPASSTR